MNFVQNIFPRLFQLSANLRILYLYKELQHSSDIPGLTVIKAGQGDRTAQSALYAAYSKAMYNLCIRMTGHAPDAQDVLQDAFVHAFGHLHQLKQPEAFGGWLHRIVINHCIRFSRDRLRWEPMEGETDDLPGEGPEWWSSIPLQVAHEEIKRLPEGCRQVFVLYVLEDLGHREIAENLGISESTSKSQYQRARRLLKERITQKIVLNG